MRKVLCLFILLPGLVLAQAEPFDSLTQSLTRSDGFIPFYYNDDSGEVLLDVPANLGDFIYQTSLAAGLGSNDIGLDRGQLGDTRLVRFRKTGNKLLLEQPNQDYRAESNNAAERASVAEAFATSVLAGLPILATNTKGVGDSVVTSYLVNLTPLLLQDAYGVANRLEGAGQGSYNFDELRSAVYAPRTKNFPKNSEFEATITLVGKAKGSELRSVVPTPDAVTTRQHHSFVALPPAGYQTRAFDPRSGSNGIAFADYASPIGQPLVKRLAVRHRLAKQDISQAQSAPVEPIVYYVDPGAPEPVRSALIEGASWWNRAFEAAGYSDAFRVEVLPEGADPLDVRYNVIQWVHRSTRGWSYGASVVDPRTGEIIKGHVSLGSLRVRQDYLIAQGLIEAYNASGEADPRLLEFSLARLRQLSAHEVGHTLGLAHNFAASADDRASVMDYPHPLAMLNETTGDVDLSMAYAVGIGDWDKQAIKYAYADFGNRPEAPELARILKENRTAGLEFISDRDARAVGGAHPSAHLWDNNTGAATELERISSLRANTLRNLSLSNLAPGRPVAELENVLAPVYYAHRYQVEAAAKLIGGVNYAYDVNTLGETPTSVEPVRLGAQRQALKAVTQTLTPAFLALPDSLLAMLPPQPIGYSRDRELFDSYTGVTFDPLAAAEASVDHTLTYLLNAQRITRVLEQQLVLRPPATDALAAAIYDAVKSPPASKTAMSDMLHDMVVSHVHEHALSLAADMSAPAATRAYGLQLAEQCRGWFNLSIAQLAMQEYLVLRYQQFQDNPAAFAQVAGARIPDGSPIGCGE